MRACVAFMQGENVKRFGADFSRGKIGGGHFVPSLGIDFLFCGFAGAIIES